MLNEDITEKRKARHKSTQEDFTPIEICKKLFEDFKEENYKDFSKTFCDICCGTGNIIRFFLKERLNYCKTDDDVYKALETIYGTELMEDNTEECKQKIVFDCLSWSSEHNIDLKDKKLIEIVNHNIVCTDTFKWDYENWKPIDETK